jgi:putative ABC transport system permease protein
MTNWSRLLNRLSSWAGATLRRSRMEGEMDAELRFHIEARVEELLRGGVPRPEALRRARIEFGGIEETKEECRESRGLNLLENFFRDLGYGARILRRFPGFSAIAIISLALGIMAATAMYSVIYGVVLHPFPYRDVDSLMSVRVWSPEQSGFRVGYTIDQFLEIAERNTIFDGVIASTISDVLWTSRGEPQRLRGNVCTMNTFDVMGVRALIGITPLPADGQPGAAGVAVLGYKFWQREFGGDPNVLGRQMILNGTPRTIVAVMPRRFMFRGADVYLPTRFQRGQLPEGVRWVHLLGRLKPGVTASQAQADLSPIIASLKQREPAAFPEKCRVGLLSFKETFPSGISEILWILFGAVGLLLLISCANVSNLLLSRATSRQREIALRASLGATRARIINQLLTESLLLSTLAGILGAGMAFGALRAIIALVPPDSIPDEANIAIDQPVLLFTLAVSFLTALLFGLTPALQVSRGDIVAALKESGRGIGAGLRQVFASNVMVVAEVALSLVLVVGATLMIRTVLAIQNVSLGIRTDRLLTMRVPLSPQRYAEASRRVAFFDELLRRVEHLPGVEAAGLNSGMHPFFSGMEASVEIPGATHLDTRLVLIHQVSLGYTRVFGIGLLQGRLFTKSELASRSHFAVANQTFVRRYFPDGAPLGRVATVPRLGAAPFNISDGSFQIIGVVRDAVNRGITREIAPELYIPYTILGSANYLAVLTNTEPATLAKAVTEQVYAIDADQPVTEVRTVSSLLNDWEYAGPRFSLVLFGIFAALGLTLAVVGVYGVVSNAVSQRTHEIGVRRALGAGPGDVLGLVFRIGARFVLLGIAIGLAVSLAAARILSSQLWRVSPHDPAALASVVLILLLVGFLACWIPARRAARVDPLVALRYE